ncbi:GSCOCG00011067001-RA-CDS [Cotesia congregata]|nr:GSCOCG00011067001-RA-CDS [Cotesia congregata]
MRGKFGSPDLSIRGIPGGGGGGGGIRRCIGGGGGL